MQRLGCHPIIVCVTWILLLFLLVPVLVTFPLALTDNDYLSLPSHGPSLKNFQALAMDSAWLSSALRSALVAAAVALLSTVLGGLCAFACWQLLGPWATAIRVIVLLPLIVPHIVVALSFNRTWTILGLFDTYPGVVLAQVILALPIIFLCASASFALFDPMLVRAARNLGAGRIRVLWSIVLPSVRAGLYSGAVFAFVSSWDEIVVLMFISGRHVQLLPKKMLQGIMENVDPNVAAVAAILVILTILGALLAAIYRKRPGELV